MIDVTALQAKLGYTFGTESALRLALTHPSASADQADVSLQYQRLEFLGDAVLQLTLTEALYRQYPCLGEGALTQARARLVNRRALAELGRALDLGSFLQLSRGEDASGGRDRPSILADTFEAVLGAVYLDGGLDAARAVVRGLLSDAIETVAAPRAADNPKGALQERLQVESPRTPTYRVERVTGPDHDREFECAVYLDGAELGRGTGKSKKEAEIQAAQAALDRAGRAASSAPPDPDP